MLDLQERFKRSVNGEELPYIFGVPLNKEKQKVSNEYDKKEMILSEAVMNYWCNFAETGWVITSCQNRYYQVL